MKFAMLVASLGFGLAVGEFPPDPEKIKLPHVPPVVSTGYAGFPVLPKVNEFLQGTTKAMEGFSLRANQLGSRLKRALKQSSLRMQKQKHIFDDKLQEQEVKNQAIIAESKKVAHGIISAKKANMDFWGEASTLQLTSQERRKELILLQKEVKRIETYVAESLAKEDKQLPEGDVLARGSAKAKAKLAHTSANHDEDRQTQPEADDEAETSKPMKKTSKPSQETDDEAETSKLMKKTSKPSQEADDEAETNKPTKKTSKPSQEADDEAETSKPMKKTSKLREEADDEAETSKPMKKTSKLSEEADDDVENEAGIGSKPMKKTSKPSEEADDDVENEAGIGGEGLSFLEVSESSELEQPDLEDEPDDNSFDEPENMVSVLQSAVEQMRSQGKKSEKELKKTFLADFKAGSRRKKALEKQKKVLTSTMVQLDDYQAKLARAEKHMLAKKKNGEKRIHKVGDVLKKLGRLASTAPEEAVPELQDMDAEKDS